MQAITQFANGLKLSALRPSILAIMQRQTAVVEPAGYTDFPPVPKLNELTTDHLEREARDLMESAIQAARNWQKLRRVQQERGETVNASLVLLATDTGNPDVTGYGCGKTHIARACLWSIAHVVDGTPMAPAGDFFPSQQIILDNSGGSVTAKLGKKPIIVIDDVGTEGTLPYIATHQQKNEIRTRYYSIVNYAYEHGISLILTANMTVNQLADHIGGRAWSRLQQMAPRGSTGSLIVDMTGIPDYRKKAGGR